MPMALCHKDYRTWQPAMPAAGVKTLACTEAIFTRSAQENTA